MYILWEYIHSKYFTSEKNTVSYINYHEYLSFFKKGMSCPLKKKNFKVFFQFMTFKNYDSNFKNSSNISH